MSCLTYLNILFDLFSASFRSWAEQPITNHPITIRRVSHLREGCMRASSRSQQGGGGSWSVRTRIWLTSADSSGCQIPARPSLRGEIAATTNSTERNTRPAMGINQIRFLTQNQESGTRKSKSPHSGFCYLELLSITLSSSSSQVLWGFFYQELIKYPAPERMPHSYI